MTDSTYRQWQKKFFGGHVVSISVVNFNFDKFILF